MLVFPVRGYHEAHESSPAAVTLFVLQGALGEKGERGEIGPSGPMVRTFPKNVVKHSSKVCLLMPYIYCLIPYITNYNTERELLSTLPEIQCFPPVFLSYL